VKRAVREKEVKAPMVSLAVSHKEVERLLLAGRPEVEHPPLAPSTVKSSHNTERSNQRKELHGQGRNNPAVICDSGSGNRDSGAALFCGGPRCGVPM